MRLIYQDKYKRVYKTGAGEIKEIPLDKDHRIAVAQGVHVQPVGKHEREFFSRNQHLKKGYLGYITDKHKERNKKKAQNKEAEELAQELYKEHLKKRGMGKVYL